MRIGTSNIFQNASFINKKMPFAGKDINAREFIKANKANRNDNIQNKPKPQTPLERLMAQRQNVTDQKYSLIGKTLEKGGDINTIKTQLDAYDEQLKAIDSQISALMAEEVKKQAEKETEKKSKEPKTKEEIQAEKMQSVVFNSGSVEQAEVLQSAKKQLEAEAKILTVEIAQDNSLSAGGALDSKIDRLAEAESQAAALNNTVIDTATNINDNISNDKSDIKEIKEDNIKEDDIIKEDNIKEDNIKEKENYTKIDVYA